jgi:acyl carrier protein
MSDHLDHVVRRTITKHLGIQPDAIRPFHDLRRDLHLQPLDLVLIAIALEDAQRIELPIAHLDAVATVAALTALVRRVHGCARHVYEPAFVPIYRRYRRARRFARRLQEI